MHIVLTLDNVIQLILIGIIILIIVIDVTKYFLNKFLIKIKYYHNCLDCKNYKLTGVTSYGGIAHYHCNKTGKYDNLDFNDSTVFCHCKYFKEKEDKNV